MPQRKSDNNLVLILFVCWTLSLYKSSQNCVVFSQGDFCNRLFSPLFLNLALLAIQQSSISNRMI